MDLPGTCTLTTISSQTSLDEQIACHYILSGDADLLINVVDASNLERNLYLTLQLLRTRHSLHRGTEHAPTLPRSKIFVLKLMLCRRVLVAQ